MSTERLPNVFCFVLLAILSTVSLLWSDSQSAEISASIQATAHVEGPLGLTEVSPETILGVPDVETGNLLFWLYSPSREGVSIMVDRSGASLASGTSETVPFVSKADFQYSFVSLVELPAATGEISNSSGQAVITVIFTNN